MYGVPTIEILTLYLTSLGNLFEIFKKENKRKTILEVLESIKAIVIKKFKLKDDVFENTEESFKKNVRQDRFLENIQGTEMKSLIGMLSFLNFFY